MRKRELESGELDDTMVEAQAQIEALQSAAADAEARAATAQAQLAELRESGSAAAAEMAGLQAARDSAQAELAQARSELGEARSELREAAAKYRAARLAAAPEVPHDLVPAVESLEEIDREFEAAQRVVQQLREKMEQETRSARVPAGSPTRRPPDLSALSPGEKIKLGLQELERR
ncbi:MAG: hypothetical protein Q7T33_07320 [Dehalococcoidia bacterium]|nr:hypothetical protein [Dehalococcoidia bacterium]